MSPLQLVFLSSFVSTLSLLLAVALRNLVKHSQRAFQCDDDADEFTVATTEELDDLSDTVDQLHDDLEQLKEAFAEHRSINVDFRSHLVGRLQKHDTRLDAAHADYQGLREVYFQLAETVNRALVKLHQLEQQVQPIFDKPCWIAVATEEGLEITMGDVAEALVTVLKRKHENKPPVAAHAACDHEDLTRFNPETD